MNTKSTILGLCTVFAMLIPSFAADEHGHEHAKKSAGPNGGRVIDDVHPKLEFFVTKENKIEITPLTDDLKPGQLSGQIISVTAGDRSNPTKMEMTETDGKLISTNPLPDGKSIPVSVSIKADAARKAVYEKFNLNLAQCPECKLPEYACTCSH